MKSVEPYLVDLTKVNTQQLEEAGEGLQKANTRKTF